MDRNVKKVLSISCLLFYLTLSNSVTGFGDLFEDDDFVCDCLKMIENEDSEMAEPLYCPDYRNSNPVRRAT